MRINSHIRKICSRRFASLFSYPVVCRITTPDSVELMSRPSLQAPSRDGQKYRYFSLDGGNGTAFNDHECNHYARVRYLMALSTRHADTNLGIALYQEDTRRRTRATTMASTATTPCPVAEPRSAYLERPHRHGGRSPCSSRPGRRRLLTFRRETESDGLAKNDTAAVSAFSGHLPHAAIPSRQRFGYYSPDCSWFDRALSPTLMYRREKSFLWLYWMPNNLSGNTRHGFGSFALGLGQGSDIEPVSTMKIEVAFIAYFYVLCTTIWRRTSMLNINNRNPK